MWNDPIPNPTKTHDYWHGPLAEEQRPKIPYVERVERTEVDVAKAVRDARIEVLKQRYGPNHDEIFWDAALTPGGAHGINDMSISSSAEEIRRLPEPISTLVSLFLFWWIVGPFWPIVLFMSIVDLIFGHSSEPEDLPKRNDGVIVSPSWEAARKARTTASPELPSHK